MDRTASRYLLLPLTVAAQLCLGHAQQSQPPAENRRVESLLAKMTLAEKIALVHGAPEDAATYQGEAGYLPGVPRLGIPPMRFADGPPGILTRVPSMAPPSTLALAATFSTQDAQQIGEVIGREARSHGAAVALQPFLNIARDFTFERAYNTFGEDPLLTAQLGAAQIRGIQSQHVMAQAKHYIGYDTYSRNVFVDEQTLHELYLQPFRAAVDAGVSSIMCSYNRINGAAACGNHGLLTNVLRVELGFRGFVTSDWGATHATDFINAGLDLEMSGPLAVPWNIPSYFVNQPRYLKPDADKPEPRALSDTGLPEEPRKLSYQPSDEAMPTTNLKLAITSGQVSEETLTRAAGRVLAQMERFGFLNDGANTLAVTATGNASDAGSDAAIIEKVAVDGAVLLKNESHILPLQPNQLSSLAIIGPNGAQIVAVGLTGEKAVGIPALEEGPLAALRRLAASSSRIQFAAADDMDGTPVPASAFSHFGEPGLLRRMWNENAVHVDPDVNFLIAGAHALPAEATTVWTGTLSAPEAGTYRMHLQLLGCYGKLYIDDIPVAKTWFNWIHGEITQAGQDNIFPTTDGLDNVRAAVSLAAGPHSIRIEVAPDTSHAPEQVRLNWITPSQQRANYAAAIEAARHANTAIVFAWSRTRPEFALPGDQNQLIHDVAAANPNTVVVLNVSQPVAMPWLPEVKAVLDMGWTGDRGGPATARLLLGEASPGGRLPFSWPLRLTNLPATDPAHPERSNGGVDGRTTFSEGLLVGYRSLAHQHIAPLFPFGYGLSYTSFQATHPVVRETADGVDVTLTIHNKGSVAGDDVVQIYLDKPAAAPVGVQFADSKLVAFQRVSLAQNETRKIQLHIAAEQLRYWDAVTHAWAIVKGPRTAWIGADVNHPQLSFVIPPQK